MLYPRPLERLLAEFEKLPGIGPKSAQRLAFHLLRGPQQNCVALAEVISTLKERIHPCSNCGNFTDEELCSICLAPRRQNGQLCIVAEARDVLAVENSNEYYGRYHVLGGVVNPIEGVGPADLNLGTLKRRLANEEISEVILALSPTVEGETTASFLAGILADCGVSITQLARGLPFGGDLDYADQVTMAGALRGRRQY